nr:hypothetical protein [Tanacetum cinerariifolium]
HQHSEFSSPETGLVVLVFQKGDDPIDAINHMMSFLTAVVTSRGGRILCQLVRPDHLHQDEIALLANLSHYGYDNLAEDSLNSAAGGNFLDKMPRECLKIIESKSKVCQSRAKAVVAKVSTSSSTPAVSSEVAELKDMVRALLLDKKNQSSAPAPSSTPVPFKAVESNCVTCGGTHSYQNCPATSGNVYRDNIQDCKGYHFHHIHDHGKSKEEDEMKMRKNF